LIHVDQTTASALFNRFSIDNYKLFLRFKKLPEKQVVYDHVSDSYTLSTAARFASQLDGSLVVPTRSMADLSAWLFDYQTFIVNEALRAKRYAIWADCGLGKTPMGMEFLRVIAHGGGKALESCPPRVVREWKKQAKKFYGSSLELRHLKTREQLVRWLKEKPEGEIGLCSHFAFEAGQIPELRNLDGLGIDESSFLKSGGGVIKWNMIHSAKGIEYKLSKTATPAPNDTMEFASQASFLEKLRTEGEILWTFFQKVGDTGEWELRPHAREAFFRFMASWSIYLRDPARFGFKDNLKEIPEPQYFEHDLPATPEQLAFAESVTGGLINLFDAPAVGVAQRTKLSQAGKGFIYGKGSIPSLKPEFTADLARSEVSAGRPTVVWCVFDAEEEALHELIPGSVILAREPDQDKALDAFEAGDIGCMLMKASSFGFGGDMPFIKSMIFSGWTDSYEQFYQAVRRGYRYGQVDPLRIHIPIVRELEGMTWDNVKRKADNFERDATEQEKWYLEALKEAA
jgi:hypothetical protein